jgi:hypothetical protein
MRGSVRVRRKPAKKLVDALGAELHIRDARVALADGDRREVLVAIFHEQLAWLVRSAGGGGALYSIRYIDMQRQVLLEAVHDLRRAVELGMPRPAAEG